MQKEDCEGKEDRYNRDSLNHKPGQRFCQGTFRIVPQEVLWSIWGSHKTWSPHLQNVTWHSGTWSSTVTTLTDQTLHQFWTYHRTGPYYQFWHNYQISGGFHRTLQRVRLANRGRLLLRTPGPVPFGTCICSNVETILSWTCHVYGTFEFGISLGTSILLTHNYYGSMCRRIQETVADITGSKIKKEPTGVLSAKSGNRGSSTA